MCEKVKDDFQYEILKLISYMIVSARGLVLEPKLYGPLRLIDSVSRLVAILDKKGLATKELLELKEKIDKNKTVLMVSREKFIDLLKELVISVTAILDKYNNKPS